MCEPISMGIATGLSSFIGQSQAASAQEQAQARASRAEQERARRANTALRSRQAQENIAISQRKEAAQIKTMEARSRARLIALTESGVAGMSLSRITDELTAKQARYEASEARQREFVNQSREFQLEENAIRSHMNQLRINQPIKQASILESGIAGSQAYLQTAQVFTKAPAPNPGS